MFTVINYFVTASQRFWPGMLADALDVGVTRLKVLLKSGHLAPTPAADPVPASVTAPVAPPAS